MNLLVKKYKLEIGISLVLINSILFSFYSIYSNRVNISIGQTNNFQQNFKRDFGNAFVYLIDKFILVIAQALSITNYLNIQAILFGRYGNGTYSSTMIITSLLDILIVFSLVVFTYKKVTKSRC